MKETLWDRLRRYRTWAFNALSILLISPDLYLALTGYDWSLIIPPRFMPYVTLAIIIINVLMRPHPAVLPSDPEAGLRKDRLGRGR